MSRNSILCKLGAEKTTNRSGEFFMWFDWLMLFAIIIFFGSITFVFLFNLWKDKKDKKGK